LGRGLRRQRQRRGRREVNLTELVEHLPLRRHRHLADIECLPQIWLLRLLAELVEHLPLRRHRPLADIECLPQIWLLRLLAELVERLLPRPIRLTPAHDGRRSGNATTLSPDGGSSCSKPLRAISSAWCAINFE